MFVYATVAGSRQIREKKLTDLSVIVISSFLSSRITCTPLLVLMFWTFIHRQALTHPDTSKQRSMFYPCFYGQAPLSLASVPTSSLEDLDGIRFIKGGYVMNFKLQCCCYIAWNSHSWTFLLQQSS